MRVPTLNEGPNINGPSLRPIGIPDTNEGNSHDQTRCLATDVFETPTSRRNSELANGAISQKGHISFPTFLQQDGHLEVHGHDNW